MNFEITFVGTKRNTLKILAFYNKLVIFTKKEKK